MLTLRNLFERNFSALLLPLFNLGFSGTLLLLVAGAWQRATTPRAVRSGASSECYSGECCSGTR